MTRAILQAPSFIYLTELGDSAAASPPGTTTLTPNETASLLSYLVTAGPPDKELLDNIDVDGDRRRPRAAPAAPLA